MYAGIGCWLYTCGGLMQHAASNKYSSSTHYNTRHQQVAITDTKCATDGAQAHNKELIEKIKNIKLV